MQIAPEPDCVQIVEVSPRDGLQNESAHVSTENKISLIQRAAESGAKRIEVASFVSPKAVPQMADAEDVVTGVKNHTNLFEQGVSLSGLALNLRGAQRAIAADVSEINFVILASESFNFRNQGATIADSLAELERSVELAQTSECPVTITIGAAFGCPFEGNTDPHIVADIASFSASLSVSEISLADTIGVASPSEVEWLFTNIRSLAPNIPLRCHFHNTRNTGIANVYAAFRSGVTVFDSSIGGIGGCPFAPAATGNVATEDVVYLFERMDVQTGLDLERLRTHAGWLQDEIIQKPLPSALLKAGGFETSAGCFASR